LIFLTAATRGLRLARLLKKAHLLRCAQSPRSNVSVNTPPPVDFSRASHLDLFEQPGIIVFQHSVALRQCVISRLGPIGVSRVRVLQYDSDLSGDGRKNRDQKGRCMSANPRDDARAVDREELDYSPQSRLALSQRILRFAVSSTSVRWRMISVASIWLEPS
jgi:hypothetical protein